MAKVAISITIDEGLLERIDRIAAASGENRSALIERLLRDSLTEEETILDPAVRSVLMSAVSSPSVIKSLTKELEKSMDEKEFKLVADRLYRFRRRPRPKKE